MCMGPLRTPLSYTNCRRLLLNQISFHFSKIPNVFRPISIMARSNQTDRPKKAPMYLLLMICKTLPSGFQRRLHICPSSRACRLGYHTPGPAEMYISDFRQLPPLHAGLGPEAISNWCPTRVCDTSLCGLLTACVNLL